jgi:hypothetical protein
MTENHKCFAFEVYKNNPTGNYRGSPKVQWPCKSGKMMKARFSCIIIYFGRLSKGSPC